MHKKMRIKKIKLKWLVPALVVALSSLYIPSFQANAERCPALKVIFARGSGAPLEDNEDYQNFKNSMTEKLNLIDLDYEISDLDYPAVGIDNIVVAAGAYFGAGESYEFGKSVDTGVKKLINIVNNTCPNTKFVVAGYSQGAMVVSKALPSLKANKIIYAATFGDPKIYLPEGEGISPPACRNENLSNYRISVPDCYAYEGMLGSYRPYQPEEFIDKLGTWCNRFDILCSSYFGISSHVSYVNDGLYEDASKLIFAKVTNAFNIPNHYVSLHDTAILIDATSSMYKLIAKYKIEALRLARETLENGGRVALYDFRDLNDPYQPVQHCSFDTCTMEVFEEELRTIFCNNGGDDEESLLSASFTVMNELNWKAGATKSLVVLTDAGFHSPDIDDVSLDDVVRLSKSIDPVNFYIITTPEEIETYQYLAEATDGAVVNVDGDLSLLTDEILARFDSLPRVEENDDPNLLPSLEVLNVEDNFDGVVTVRFNSSGEKTLVILNDAVLGVTEENFITLSGLDRTVSNTLRLVPLSENRRGIGVEVGLGTILVPKAPDTGAL